MVCVWRVWYVHRGDKKLMMFFIAFILVIRAAWVTSRLAWAVCLRHSRECAPPGTVVIVLIVYIYTGCQVCIYKQTAIYVLVLR